MFNCSHIQHHSNIGHRSQDYPVRHRGLCSLPAIIPLQQPDFNRIVSHLVFGFLCLRHCQHLIRQAPNDYGSNNASVVISDDYVAPVLRELHPCCCHSFAVFALCKPQQYPAHYCHSNVVGNSCRCFAWLLHMVLQHIWQIRLQLRLRT